MAFFGALNTGPTGAWFGNIARNLAAIAANFALIEPGVVDDGNADHVLALTDVGKTVLRSRATAQTQTLPSNATAAIPIGAAIPVIQTGAGALTFQAGAGATVTKLAAKSLVASAQHARVTATKISTNGWHIGGDLT